MAEPTIKPDLNQAELYAVDALRRKEQARKDRKIVLNTWRNTGTCASCSMCSERLWCGCHQHAVKPSDSCSSYRYKYLPSLLEKDLAQTKRVMLIAAGEASKKSLSYQMMSAKAHEGEANTKEYFDKKLLEMQKEGDDIHAFCDNLSGLLDDAILGKVKEKDNG